jgi:hypothetical protein
VVAVAGLVLASGGPDGAGGGRAGAQVPTFRGEVRVEETAIVVQPPGPRFWLPDDLDPPDLLVSEDGLLRRVTRVEPLADSGRSWTQVVYVDRRLAQPETVFLATLALAKRARSLAALGEVEVVEADPAPHVVLPATREARRIELVLSDLAGAARVERDRAGGRRPAVDPPQAAATARRQFDRLLVHLTARSGSGPRALFLVSEIAPPDTAPLLAGYGWLTLPMPVRRGDVDVPGQPVSDDERARHRSQEGWNPATVPPLFEPMLVFPPRRRGTLASLEIVAALYTAPDLAPLRELVVQTGGHLLGYDEQLDPALAALAGRWLVWVEVPAGTPANRLRRLEIRTLRGEALRTFRWAASGTPPEIEAARQRLAGGAPVDAEP